MPVSDANIMRTRIGSAMRDSVDSPDRYPLGEIGFVDTQVVGRIIGSLVRTQNHPDNVPIRQIRGLPSGILRKVTQVAPRISRGRLLGMPLAETQDRFGLDTDEALSLRRAALGLAGPAPDPKTRWDRPAPRGGGGKSDDSGPARQRPQPRPDAARRVHEGKAAGRPHSNGPAATVQPRTRRIWTRRDYPWPTALHSASRPTSRSTSTSTASTSSWRWATCAGSPMRARRSGSSTP